MTNRQATIRSYAPGVMLAGLAVACPWLEQTMARHMGLELPGLFIMGWIAAGCAGERLTSALADWNANGLPGLLFAMCVTAFWMVPAALDSAVLNGGMAIVKVASLVVAGLLARASRPLAPLAVQAFFGLNWFWMTLAAGLLYQDAPQQLCSVYLTDQQAQAGRVIVMWAVFGFGAWLMGTASLLRHSAPIRRGSARTPLTASGNSAVRSDSRGLGRGTRT